MIMGITSKILFANILFRYGLSMGANLKKLSEKKVSRRKDENRTKDRKFPLLHRLPLGSTVYENEKENMLSKRKEQQNERVED